MAEVAFANPEYLWILVLVPILIFVHFLTLKQSKAAVIRFANFEAIERVSKGEFLGTPYRGILKNKDMGLLSLRALIYCLLILSAAGTSILYQGTASNFDYVLAIDTSSSMLANDLIPSRLDAAKAAAEQFTSIMPPRSNVGIVTFASTSIIELRPTSDLQQIKDAISNIDLQETGGTAIGDAIITSTNLFSLNKSRIIILLTDGQNNAGVNPDVAVEYARQNNAAVYAIGVATKKGGNVSALNLISKLDEGLLKRISEETSGRFFVVDTTENLAGAFREIASSTKKQLSMGISWLLLIGAIVLLGFEWILINTIYKTIP